MDGDDDDDWTNSALLSFSCVLGRRKLSDGILAPIKSIREFSIYR